MFAAAAGGQGQCHVCAESCAGPAEFAAGISGAKVCGAVAEAAADYVQEPHGPLPCTRRVQVGGGIILGVGVAGHV